MSSFVEYVQCVRVSGTTPNGVFAAKLMRTYLPDFLDRLREPGDEASDFALLARHFPAPRFIWIQRRDVIAQAVSWSKAIQTGRWHHWDTPGVDVTPVYDREQIDALARQVAAHDKAWQAWFAENEIGPFRVRFEDLVSEPVRITEDVLRFLGIAADNVQVRHLTERSGDRVNDEWLQRHRAAT